ncbi:MAG: chloramphenicol phosphotransferase [Actinomycetota bacterium]
MLLNGAPRSGKSSIASSMQAVRPGRWTNLGVDSTMAATAEAMLPGIGLRPGGERPDLEPLVLDGYRELFDALAEVARRGGNVVADVGIHDDYSRPLGLWLEAAERLDGLTAHVVGVRCPLPVIMARRAEAPVRGRSRYATADADGTVPTAVRRWQRAVHEPGRYDLEVDTSLQTSEQCARRILAHLDTTAPSALARHRSL